LVRLLRLRQTLFATYTAVFGLQASVAWVPAYDGEIANVTSIKDFVAQLDNASFSAQYHLNNFRKDRIRDAIATIAQGIAVRIADKDYVFHATYSAEKKTVVVTLIDIAEEAALEFRPTSEEIITALKDRVTAVTTQMKDLEAKIEVAVANQSSELPLYRAQYKDLQAELSLLQAAGYGETRAVLEANLAANESATYAPPNQNPDNNANLNANYNDSRYTATYDNPVRLIWTPQYNSAETQPAKP
jgi:hypothetical protein